MLDGRAGSLSLPASADGPTVEAAQAEQPAPSAQRALDLHEGLWTPEVKRAPELLVRTCGSKHLRLLSDQGELGKHEELAHKVAGATRVGCVCRSKHLRLRSNHGELVAPRGKCVNRCDYCAKLAAVENGEMLALDALDGYAPTILAITGTRTATLNMEAFKTARRRLSQEMKRRWPDRQWAYEVEYTTGYGPKSGGWRRPHWNWLIKGVPIEDLDELREMIRRVWCRYVDAQPERQYVEAIRSPAAALKYITAHYMKASQRPPNGFSGQRFNCSRGYFGESSVCTARARARSSLRHKRELWKAQAAGHSAHDVELLAHEAMKEAAATRWVLTNERGARLGKESIEGPTLVWRLFLGLREGQAAGGGVIVGRAWTRRAQGKGADDDDDDD